MQFTISPSLDLTVPQESNARLLGAIRVFWLKYSPIALRPMRRLLTASWIGAQKRDRVKGLLRCGAQHLDPKRNLIFSKGVAELKSHNFFKNEENDG